MAWQPAPTTDTWRGRSLWRTPAATVAATGEGAAADVLAVYERLLGAYAAIGEAPPAAPLLIAVDAADGALLGDVDRTATALPRCHMQVVSGEPPPGETGVMLPRDGSAGLSAAIVGTLTAAVPLGDAELALPESWQHAADWGAVLPTDATIAAATDLLVDEGMAQADLNFGQRLLAAPFMPWIRGAMRDKLREMGLRLLVDASCAPGVLGRPFANDRKVALLAALGLPEKMQAPALPGGADTADGKPGGPTLRNP